MAFAGQCRGLEGRTKRGSFSLGLSALSCPPLAVLCPSDLSAPLSGWGATASGMEEKWDLVPGAEGRSLGWAWLDGGVMPGEEVAVQWSPSVKRALSCVGMGPPEVGH